jgi:hypothetical protein
MRPYCEHHIYPTKHRKTSLFRESIPFKTCPNMAIEILSSKVSNFGKIFHAYLQNHYMM